ncbi:hypothetical protein TNCV_1780241 [Trichonephila clavipes]|nr:hypothetical protein TNCV_1780241 [Trichonephila clavipes]
MLDNIVDERKSLEIEALKKIKREDKFLADQRAFELEKLKLQAQNPPASVVALLDIEVYEATGTVCADTGASQSLGEN